jgi:hypothetical protein
MLRIRLEYDAYDRKFKLIDREFGSILDDGAVYELSIPLAVNALDDGCDESVCIGVRVAQA